MSTTPQPPPGFRIIPPEWLAMNPLPGDGIFTEKQDPMWSASDFRGTIPGEIAIQTHHYATAQPLDCFEPTPDFRALCEEMVQALKDVAEYASCAMTCDACDGAEPSLDQIETRANTALTRANAALKETQP
jgi:hypothetical protein